MVFLFAGEPLQMSMSAGPAGAFLTVLWVTLCERVRLCAWSVLGCLFDLSVCNFAFFSAADTGKAYSKPFDNRLALLGSSWLPTSSL